MNKKAIIDIDGCLNYYPQCFLDWLSNIKGLKFDNYDSFKSHFKESYILYKNEYRLSGVKRELEVKSGSSEYINQLKQKGYIIYIVTSRHNIGNVYQDTYYWLKNNGIYFDELFFIKKKGDLYLYCPDTNLIVVDDDINGLKPYFNLNNVDLVYFNSSRKKEYFSNNIKYVESWEELILI